MSDNATQGGRRVSLAKPDLWYFDKLPPTARKALADAAFNWSSGAMYNSWNRGEKGYKSGLEIAKRVKEADAATRKKKRLKSR